MIAHILEALGVLYLVGFTIGVVIYWRTRRRGPIQEWERQHDFADQVADWLAGR